MSREESSTSSEPSVDAKPEVLIELREPHTDWELNQLLIDISDEVTEKELSTLKYIFSGKKFIVLNRSKIDIFFIRYWIDRRRIHCLQDKYKC